MQIIAKQTSHKSMDQVPDLESFRINLTHLYFNQDMCYSITITYLVWSIDIKKCNAYHSMLRTGKLNEDFMDARLTCWDIVSGSAALGP